MRVDIDQVVANLAGKVLALPAAIPSMESGTLDGVVWTDSGLASDTFNCVVGRPQPGAANSCVKQLSARYARARLPAAWWLAAPTPDELELEGALADAGFVHEETHVAMARGLEGLAQPSARVELEVRRSEDLAHFGEVIAGPEATADSPDRRFYALAHAAKGAARLHHLVGRVGDDFVATASVFLADCVAGIYDVTTRASVRGQGIGSSMTAHAMALAAELGARALVLQASPDGLGVYERLGFARVGLVHTWARAGGGAEGVEHRDD